MSLLSSIELDCSRVWPGVDGGGGEHALRLREAEEGPSVQVLEALALGEEPPSLEELADETACSLGPAGRADLSDLIFRFQVRNHCLLPTGRSDISISCSLVIGSP